MEEEAVPAQLACCSPSVAHISRTVTSPSGCCARACRRVIGQSHGGNSTHIFSRVDDLLSVTTGRKPGLKRRRSGCRFVRLFLRNITTIFQEIGSKKRENALLMSEVRGQTGGVTFQLLALRQPAHTDQSFSTGSCRTSGLKINK